MCSTRAHWRHRPDLDPLKLERTAALMCKAIPDCFVNDYSHHIGNLELPDPDDRHVLAAAIEGDVDFIVSANCKDFPDEYLRRFGIACIPPDAFLASIIARDRDLVLQTVEEMSQSSRKPPRSVNDILAALARSGAAQAAKRLADQPFSD